VPETVDARRLPCPQPVVLTRRVLRRSDALVAIVDNDSSRRNVSRMAEKAGFAVRTEVRDDGIYLYITRESAHTPATEPVPTERYAAATGPLVLVVPSETMGRGEHGELGQILVRGFFHALGEIEPLPQTIIFFNSGVKLVIEGSPLVEDLQALSERGVEILACGTCLGYYGGKDGLVVGEVSNMYTIAETMLRADKVIAL